MPYRLDAPPQVGPYGRAEQVGGRWVIRLTEEGRHEVRAFLDRCGGKPLNLLSASSFGNAIRFGKDSGLTGEEMNELCRSAVNRAVAKWRPDGGSRLTTYAVWWMRSAVQRAAEARCKCWRQSGGLEHGDVRLEGKRGDTILSLQPARYDADLDPERRERRRLIAERVRASLRKVPARYREIFAVRVGLDGGLPRTLEETGKRFGLCRERVRQVEKRVIAKLRRDLEAVYLDLCDGEV